MLLYSLGTRYQRVLERTAALKTHWKTCMVKGNARKAQNCTSKAYYFAIEEIFVTFLSCLIV